MMFALAFRFLGSLWRAIMSSTDAPELSHPVDQDQRIVHFVHAIRNTYLSPDSSIERLRPVTFTRRKVRSRENAYEHEYIVLDVRDMMSPSHHVFVEFHRGPTFDVGTDRNYAAIKKANMSAKIRSPTQDTVRILSGTPSKDHHYHHRISFPSTDDPNHPRITLFEVLVIANTVYNYLCDYTIVDQNCYAYSELFMSLTERVFGLTRNSMASAGKAGHIGTVLSTAASIYHDEHHVDSAMDVYGPLRAELYEPIVDARRTVENLKQTQYELREERRAREEVERQNSDLKDRLAALETQFSAPGTSGFPPSD
ncbi:hypothetical protein H0H87_007225 [Tephrocybe sp. NHM501043]|nr:hypothetical protein H0H87_007225 [Tephrocybe sp. NHM501043]